MQYFWGSKWSSFYTRIAAQLVLDVQLIQNNLTFLPIPPL